MRVFFVCCWCSSCDEQAFAAMMSADLVCPFSYCKPARANIHEFTHFFLPSLAALRFWLYPGQFFRVRSKSFGLLRASHPPPPRGMHPKFVPGPSIRSAAHYSWTRGISTCTVVPKRKHVHACSSKVLRRLVEWWRSLSWAIAQAQFGVSLILQSAELCSNGSAATLQFFIKCRTDMPSKNCLQNRGGRKPGSGVTCMACMFA